VGTVRDALQLPGMRRIELGYGLSITGELAGTVALVVYAVSAGGAGLVAFTMVNDSTLVCEPRPAVSGSS
jgi:hypothetical protein